jgi:chromosome segregation ATPase
MKGAVSKQKCTFTSVVQAADGKVYAVGSDSNLKVIEGEEIKSEEDCHGDTLTQLALLHTRAPVKDRVLFAGTEKGAIRMLELPLDGRFEDRQAHSGPITRMRMSPDDQYLFTASQDGCLAMYSVASRDANQLGRVRRELTLPWAEEILVTKSDLEDKMGLIAEYQSKVDELQSQNQLQLQKREGMYKEKLKEIKEKFKSELEADRKHYKLLEDEKENMEKQYALRVDALHSLQKQKLHELEQHFRHKLKVEDDRFKELERKMHASHKQWDDIVHEREERSAGEKENLRHVYLGKLAQQMDERSELERQKAKITEEFEQTKKLMEEEADREIDELKQSYDKKLTEERTCTAVLQSQNQVLRNEFKALKGDIHKNLIKLKDQSDKQKELLTKIQTLESDIKSHVKEIKERESTIADKVNRIFELRKKNQELEKFKFVLDYKIKELQRQIDPRMKELTKKGQQISQMQTEVRTYRKDSEHLCLDVKELNLKLAGMEQEASDVDAEREQIVSALRRFKQELHEVYLNIENSKLLKDGIKNLYQRHVTSELKNLIKGSAEDVHKDYQRQRKYLERSIEGLMTKSKREATSSKADAQRIMQENIVLTKEINQLRREIHVLRNSQRAPPSASAPRESSTGRLGKSMDAGAGGELEHATRRSKLEKDVEVQQEQIRALKGQLQMIIVELGRAEDFRPRPASSHDKLAPIRWGRGSPLLL